MNIYYVADTYKKVRILLEFRKLSTASAYCKLLNEKNKARFMCGDFVSHKDFGKNTANDWPWVAQSSDSAYLV